jgi:hypothetical protein
LSRIYPTRQCPRELATCRRTPRKYRECESQSDKRCKPWFAFEAIHNLFLSLVAKEYDLSPQPYHAGLRPASASCTKVTVTNLVEHF